MTHGCRSSQSDFKQLSQGELGCKLGGESMESAVLCGAGDECNRDLLGVGDGICGYAGDTGVSG